LQLAALQRAGCKRICTDKATDAHVKRSQLTLCLLGRSLRDLITLLDDLKAQDVVFRSLTEAIDQGECPVQVAYLLNVSQRTLERAVSRGGG